MHEKQRNLQEWRIGCVENIPGTYVEDEIQWRTIPLKFLFILVFIFRDSLEDIIVLIKRTSDNGQMKTGGVGEPLFDHCSLRSYLCRNNTREMDDGRTPCAKTQTVKIVVFSIIIVVVNFQFVFVTVYKAQEDCSFCSRGSHERRKH